MNRQVLVNGYATCFKLGYDIGKGAGVYGLFFDERERLWRHSGQNMTCHLVETVLLGVPDCTGDRLADVARILECSEDHLRGFIAGLAFQITPADAPT